MARTMRNVSQISFSRKAFGPIEVRIKLHPGLRDAFFRSLDSAPHASDSKWQIVSGQTRHLYTREAYGVSPSAPSWGSSNSLLGLLRCVDAYTSAGCTVRLRTPIPMDTMGDLVRAVKDVCDAAYRRHCAPQTPVRLSWTYEEVKFPNA